MTVLSRDNASRAQPPEHHALYYPEWGVPDPALLVESLLYWDRLACIVPLAGYRPLGAVDKEFSRASDALHERFVTGIAPTEEQKRSVHARIERVIDRVPPERYRPENLPPGLRANLNVMKIAPETEEILLRRGWMRPLGTGRDEMHDISPAAANLILGELVAEFESERLPAFTGDPGSYVATTNTLLKEVGSDFSMIADDDIPRALAGPTDDALMLVFPFVRAGLPHGSVTPDLLERVLELRSDPDVEGRRLQFVAKVDEYVDRVRAAPGPERPLIIADWQNALALDRTAYTIELRRAGLRTLVDKESIVSVFVGSGAAGLAAPVLGPFGLAIGVTLAAIRTAQRFQAGRGAVSAEHWSSFLFALEPPRFGVRL